MFDPVTAMVGVGVLGAAGSYFGGQAQSHAASNSLDAQNQQFQQQRQDMAPWTIAGGQAVGQLSAGMQPGGQFSSATPTMDQLNADPILKMMMSKDNNAAAAYASSVGNYGGSSMLGTLQDIQSNEYAQAYGRWQGAQNTMYNRLAGIAQTGMVGQQSVGQLGGQAATQGGMFNMMGGQAQAGMYQGLGDAAMGGVNSYLRYQALQGGGGGYQYPQMPPNYGAYGAGDLNYGMG